MDEEFGYLKEIDEWEQGKFAGVRDSKHFKETPNRKFEYIGEPYVFSEGDRKLLDQGMGVKINIPEDFKLTEENFVLALEKVRQTYGPHVGELMSEGYLIADTKYESEVDVKCVVGNMENKGWEDLAKDYSVPEMVEYIRKLISVGEYRLKSMVQQQQMEIFESNINGKKELCVGSGQHRMLALKVISEMGCDVKLTNVKVGILEKS